MPRGAKVGDCDKKPASVYWVEVTSTYKHRQRYHYLFLKLDVSSVNLLATLAGFCPSFLSHSPHN
jgi:hypothetical protein